MKGKITGLIRMIRPEITLFGPICVFIGGMVSKSDFFSFDLFLGMLAVFFIGAGCHPLNDYFDYEVDKISHPKRPLPSGIFNPIYALYIAVVFFVISLVISFLINFLCFSINIIGILLIFLYELSFKNKAFIGNAIVALTVALSFTYGGAIVYEIVKPTFFTLITFFIFLGREILMDVRDFEGDKQVRRTLPFKVGKKRSIHLASFIIAISIIMFFLPFFLGMFSFWYVLMALPVTFITVYFMLLSLIDVKNVGKTATALRFSMLFGLIVFLVSVIFL
jgi:geranylgeranylglycerol-phosphate geranylgeranyltransferase